MMSHPVVTLILWRSLAIFLLVGALMGIAVSLVLLFRPQLMTHINRLANRWISARWMNQWLDHSFDIEHWFYRHHRLLGVLTVVGAGYVMVYFGLLFDKVVALRHLSGILPARLLDWLLDVLVLTLLPGAAIALLIGLFLWLRPGLLRGIEESSNRWISSRKATRLLDIPHDEVERFVAGHMRRVGWLMLLGSLYLLFATLRLLI